MTTPRPEALTAERVERAEDWSPIERAYAEAMHEDCPDLPAGHPVDDHSPWSGGDLDGTPTWAEFTAQLARHGLTLTLATPPARQTPDGLREALDVDAFLRSLTERYELAPEWRDGIEYARLIYTRLSPPTEVEFAPECLGGRCVVALSKRAALAVTKESL